MTDSGRSPASGEPTRLLSRRGFLVHCAGSVSLAALLAACGGGAPATNGEASTSQLSLRQRVSITTAATAASETATTAAVRGEPKGKVVYAWHTTIAPAWFDPQETLPGLNAFNFSYAMHDALVKHMPGKPFSPSLAESYEVASDFKSATFKLRPGIKFHNGEAVTPEDVKFSYESYRGVSAKVLHDKTERMEINGNTIRFHFKEPFLDFMILFGSPASGAGWVVPKAYYEKVGPNGFKQKPVGAGPYKFVRQQAGIELELEAFTDYWRKTPNVKTILIRGVPEAATRVALLQTGEADFILGISGELLETVKRDPKLQLVSTKSAAVWLELLNFDRPDSPLKDLRVRQAVSLAIDRKALVDAEMGGLAPIEGNWIPADWPGALQRPAPAFDLDKARRLMNEAGVPGGFEVSTLTPLPPYFSWGERVTSQLRAINIRTKVNPMERAAFQQAIGNGPNRLKGFIIQFSATGGDAAPRIREYVLCSGVYSGLCIPEVEEKMKQYEASVDLQERQRLLNEVQEYLLDNYIFTPISRNAFSNAKGPRIANKGTDIIGNIPQYSYVGPYEDILLKEG